MYSGIAAKVLRGRREIGALADQVVVSGSNFVTAILLARCLGPSGFGVYTLWYAVLLYVNTVQAAIVVTPMMTIGPRLTAKEDRRKYYGGLFGVQALLTCMLAALVGLVGTPLLIAKPAWGNLQLLVAFIASLICFQGQEWLRRYFYSVQRGRAALANDSISYVGQLAVLLVLRFTGHLSLLTAFYAIAITSAAALVVGFFQAELEVGSATAKSAWSQSWRCGRDFLLASQVYWAGSQGLLFIAGGVLGTGSVGGIKAAQNMLGPIVVLFSAMENVLPVQASIRLVNSGYDGMVSYLKSLSAAGGACLAALLVILAATSKFLLVLFYGAKYGGYWTIVVWGALYFFLLYFVRILGYFHRSVDRSGVIVVSSCATAVVSLVATVALINRFHETAVVASGVVGQIAGVTVMLIAAVAFGRERSKAPARAIEPSIIELEAH
jgi:O-antigen/teichoic acid export membrane protein